MYNYLSGVKVLRDIHEFMITLGDNDSHFICYLKGDLDEENNLKMKNLRRYHAKNTDAHLKIKYWIVNDQDLAK